MMRVTEKPIDVGGVLAGTLSEEDGALGVFLGVVRRTARGRRVRALQYEAYAPMAELFFAEVAREARLRWGVKRMAIVHRAGLLAVGETAVLVAAASPHRKEALAACQYAIERVKADAPVWKKEFYEDGGDAWVEDCSSRLLEGEVHVQPHL